MHISGIITTMEPISMPIIGGASFDLVSFITMILINQELLSTTLPLGLCMYVLKAIVGEK